jgi:archaellum component FlaF (FlaF/FlaG flagellin family)
MRNDSSSRNTHGVHRSLTIALRGNGANTKGLGATIHLTLDDGTVISRWNTDGFGFQSSISSAMTITIPEGKIPTQVEVVWPNGTRQIVTDPQEVGIQVIVQPMSK